MKKIKILLLTLLVIFNAGCEDEEKPKERYLRLSADVRAVKAQVVRLPDGRTIDFPYVANALFYYAVMIDPHFLIDRPITIGNDTPVTQAKTAAYRETDEDLLIRWGFKKAAFNEFGGDYDGMFKANDIEPDPNQCLYHAPEIKLNANVIAFELIGSGGIHGGYPGVPVGGSLNFDRSQLTVTLGSEDPLTGKPITIDAGKSYENKLRGELDYMGVVGLDFFLKTPLFKVVAGSFKDALKNLVGAHMERLNVANWKGAWQSKVIFDPVISDGDTHIAIRGGWRANIRVGDKFEVYNMHYKWNGEECNSSLDYALPNPAMPVAEIRVVETGQDVAKGLVISALKDYRVTSGAIVKIKELVK